MKEDDDDDKEEEKSLLSFSPFNSTILRRGHFIWIEITQRAAEL